MKKTAFFNRILCASAILVALLLAGCNKQAKSEADEEPEDSVAKEATWDYFLVGSWRYVEDSNGKNSTYPEGIETFFANGDYICYTQDSNGEKVIINGTWKLDDEEDYVVWVTQEKIKNAEKTISSDDKELKYVINSIAPEKALVYQVEDSYRSAEWMGQ